MLFLIYSADARSDLLHHKAVGVIPVCYAVTSQILVCCFLFKMF